MSTIHDVIVAFEKACPLSFQEKWDNSGIQVGDVSQPCTGVMVAVEATEATVMEAVERGANLLMTHHPILFHGLKKITTTSYVERTILLAIKHDIVLYAAHTSADNLLSLMNGTLAKRLQLKNIRPLVPLEGGIFLLQVMVPSESAQSLKKTLFEAGAGQLGAYGGCAFTVSGMGEFIPQEESNPYIGEKQKSCCVAEDKISLLVKQEDISLVLRSLHAVHPYEEPAYDLIPLHRQRLDVGSGLVGDLPENLTETELLSNISKWSHVEHVAHSRMFLRSVKRVAICSGSGGSFLKNAVAEGADFYLTGEAKYNDYLDAYGYGILLATIGHYESETVAREIFIKILRDRFHSLEIMESIKDINPIQYIG